jgi:hypothetical protein
MTAVTAMATVTGRGPVGVRARGARTVDRQHRGTGGGDRKREAQHDQRAEPA